MSGIRFRPFSAGQFHEQPPPTVFTHGIQLSRHNIGASGTLNPVSFITTTSDGEVFEDLLVADGLRVRHDGVVFRNCAFAGNTAANTQTVRHNEFPVHAIFESCTVGTTSALAKCFVSDQNGATSSWTRCVFRGGDDCIFLKPTAEGPSSQDGYAHKFSECWAGDVMRFEGSHTDVFQIDGGAGGVWVQRCSLNSYCIPDQSDPFTTEASLDPENQGGGNFICTYNGLEEPIPIDNLRIEDSFFDGGQYGLRTDTDDDGPQPAIVVATGNLFTRTFRSAPMLLSPGATASNNTYADNGDPV